MAEKRSRKPTAKAPVWVCKICGAKKLVKDGREPKRCWNRLCRSHRWKTGIDKRRKPLFTP